MFALSDRSSVSNYTIKRHGRNRAVFTGIRKKDRARARRKLGDSGPVNSQPPWPAAFYTRGHERSTRGRKIVLHRGSGRARTGAQSPKPAAASLASISCSCAHHHHHHHRNHHRRRRTPLGLRQLVRRQRGKVNSRLPEGALLSICLR
jgi:hypothetical protein